MSETDSSICRICLTTSRDHNISDSSTYAKFFIQNMSLKDFNETLWLCLWCKASLRRAINVLTLALESVKLDQNEIDILRSPKRLHTLNYIHNPHIDVPPSITEHQDIKNENITEYLEEFIDPINVIQKEDEIPLKIKFKQSKPSDMKLPENTNEETKNFSNLEDDILHEGEIEALKINKSEFNFKDLKFDVEYLNLEEQMKEVEMKKVKYRDFKFQCNDCGMGYLTSDVFDEHKIRHSELTGPHKCKICGLHFKSQDVLSQHNLAHRRRFKCMLCRGVFKRWSHCIAHRYKCGGVVEPAACKVCDKIFSNDYSLKIHMKLHKAEKKHCCGQCDRKFATKQRLTVHLRSHAGIKPFQCDMCGRSFSTRSNLRAHSAAHEHTSRHYCVECHTYYKTAKSLKRHFNESAKHVALKKDAYSNSESTEQFSTEKSLNPHISTRHGTEHLCTQCDKTFSNKSNLNKHMKCIHTIK